MLPQIDRRGGCKRQKSQCGAVLGCAPASGGCSAREAEFAVAVLAEENPNGYRWGMVLRMALCGTKRQTVRRWRKEGQGGDVHAWEQTTWMRRVCMTTSASRYDRGMFNDVATRYVLHEKLLHFLSRGYTPGCLKVRYRSVALSPGPVDGSGRRWCAGIPDTMMCCS